MEKDKLHELLMARAMAEQEIEKMRSRVTILFSDIQGSTAYFERKGDLEGLAMVQRHNDLLIPIVQANGGWVVKTLGDAIMACFDDPVEAVRAAVGMQQALEADRIGEPVDEQIHIRAGLHTGLGLIQSSDVYGDVVNAASRVQHQAHPDEIIITEVLLDAARAAGVQCLSRGLAAMKGKDESLNIYAVAWSASASRQLIDELQAEFDRKMKEAKRNLDHAEEEFDNTRAMWRSERRRLTSQIEELEDSLERTTEEVRQQVSAEIHAELQFQLDEVTKGRQQIEEELARRQASWDLERAGLKAQVGALQAAAVETMERLNNPARAGVSLREQVEARLKESLHDLEQQWEAERQRLNAEIERLRKAEAATDRKDAARRALLQKLGKLPPGSVEEGARTASQWETEFHAARLKWETEKEQLQRQLQQLDRESRRSADEVRQAVAQDLRSRHELEAAATAREIARLNEELRAATTQLQEERQRMLDQIEHAERAVPEAQEAVRKQVTAELTASFESRFQELARLKTRDERRFEDLSEEWEAERRRLRKQISQLEEQLREAKDAAFKALHGHTHPASE